MKPANTIVMRRADFNWLFNDPNHCAASYVSEMRGDQNAKECSK